MNVLSFLDTNPVYHERATWLFLQSCILASNSNRRILDFSHLWPLLHFQSAPPEFPLDEYRQRPEESVFSYRIRFDLELTASFSPQIFVEDELPARRVEFNKAYWFYEGLVSEIQATFEPCRHRTLSQVQRVARDAEILFDLDGRYPASVFGFSRQSEVTLWDTRSRVTCLFGDCCRHCASIDSYRAACDGSIPVCESPD